MNSMAFRQILLLTFVLSAFSPTAVAQRAAAPVPGKAAARATPEAPKPPAPASQPASSSLSTDDVVAMVKAGLGEGVIIMAIRKEATPFGLSAMHLVRLKQAGVSDNIMKVMIDPTAPLGGESAPGAESSVASTSGTSTASPLGADVEIGVYTKKNGEWVEVLPEVINWKTGGILKRIATVGIVKGDINGKIQGPHSRNSVVAPVAFIIYAPEGVAITEYQLLRLRQNKKYREFRTVTGGILHAEGGSMRDLVPFEGKKLSTRTYEVVLPSNLGAGEYGFLPPGAFTSANAASLGKLYSFRILE